MEESLQGGSLLTEDDFNDVAATVGEGLDGSDDEASVSSVAKAIMYSAECNQISIFTPKVHSMMHFRFSRPGKITRAGLSAAIHCACDVDCGRSRFAHHGPGAAGSKKRRETVFG